MKHQRKHSEKGVALLFSLGIIGLMAVLALTYASVSMTNQSIAKNTTNISSAHEIASTLVERVKYLLTNKITTPAQLHNLYTKPDSGNYDYDWIWKLALRDNSLNDAIYSMDNINYTGFSASTPLPSWQYIKNPLTTPEQIIARFAYVAVAYYQPLVDISSVYLNDNHEDLGSTAPERKGVTVSGELNPDTLLQNVLGGDSSLTVSALFNRTDLVNSIKDNNGFRRFRSLSEIDPYTNSTTANIKDAKKQFVKAFSTTPVKYPEAFVEPFGATPTGSNVYHRINLIALAQAFFSYSDAAVRNYYVEKIASSGNTPKEFAYDTAAESLSDASVPVIPWFKDFNDTEKAGMTSEEIKKKQIIANFMDFFAPDDTLPTSNISPDTWSLESSSNAPEYTGLKKTPQISAAGADVDLSATIIANDLGGDPKNYDFTLEIAASLAPYVELANLYKEVAGGSYTLSLKGNLAFDVEVDYSGTVKTTFNFNQLVDITKTPVTLDAQTPQRQYFKIAPTSGSESGPEEIDIAKQSWKNPDVTSTNSTETTVIPSSLKITNFKFSPRIILYRNDKAVDFANLNNVPNFNAASAAASTLTWGGTGFTLDGLISGAIRPPDPRHNLTSDMWSQNLLTAKAGGTPEFFTTLNNLPKLTYNPTADPQLQENFGDYFNDYTADKTSIPISANSYIRGKAIDSDFSPWELSFIHRAAPWQTLNFSTYTGTSGVISNSYADGDLTLLDQFKLTDKNYSYGKIPLNSLDSGNIFTLLTLIKNSYRPPADDATVPLPDMVGTYQDPPRSSSSADENFLLAAQEFIEQRRRISPYYFATRINIVDTINGVTFLKNHFNADVLDQILPKLIFLLDAEPTFLPRRVYLYGAAQTINETKQTSVSKYWGTNLKVRQYMAGYRFYMDDNNAYIKRDGADPAITETISASLGTYDNGADKITGTEKVFSVFERIYTTTPYSTTQKPTWKIIETQYGK